MGDFVEKFDMYKLDHSMIMDVTFARVWLEKNH